MGILTRLFGHVGKVRFEYTEIDGSCGTAKMTFESFNVGNDELKKYLKNALYVEHGINATKIRILAIL